MRGRRAGRAGVLLATCALVAWPGRAATHAVAIEGMQFSPATLTVRRGDTVVWVNQDLVPHTATAKGAFDSGPIAPGRSWRTTVTKAGRQAVVCTLHPTMTAVLVVE